mgnify:CR=1 FL=1
MSVSAPSRPALSQDSRTFDADRLRALRRYDILDTPPEEAFDHITRLAASLLDVPYALINFIDADRQWSKSCVGVDAEDVPLEHSFCVDTIQTPGPTVVEDASSDPRFASNPFVTADPSIRFYAGTPIETDADERIGTICVLDSETRSVTQEELDRLDDLADLVAELLETRGAAAARDRAERELRRIQTAVSYATDAVLITDASGQPIYHNPRFQEIFGLMAEDLNASDDLLRLIEDDGTAEALAKTLRAGRSWTGSVRARGADGRSRQVKVNASAIVDGTDVLGFMAVLADVTHTERIERLHSGQDRILRQIAEGAELPAVLRAIVELIEGQRPALTGSVLLVGDDCLRHGAAPNLSERFVEAIDGVAIGPNVGACGTAAHRGTPVVTEDIATDPAWADFRTTALDEGLRSCWSTPIRGENGDVLGTFAFYHGEPRTPDEQEKTLAREAARIASIAIERTEREMQLQESETRYRLLAENVRDVVCLHDADGSYRWVSPSVEEVVGYTPADIIGTNPFDWIHPKDERRVRLHHANLRDGRPMEPIRYRFWHQDGHYVWLETLSRFIFDEDGDAVQIQTGSRDVTDRVQRQEDLLEAKQEAEEMNRLKSAFLANMSHEIRTPLTSIIGFAEILEEEADERHRRMSQLIHRAGSRLMETLDSVLHLSRLEAGMSRLDRTEIDVGSEIAETVDLLQPRAAEDEIALHTDLPEETVAAEVDPAALHRILDNIVSNALKFTEAGGRVDVSLRGEDDAVIITVEDTGVGIDPEFMPELFDAFKQEQTGVSRTYEGSGLGLTVVRRLVDLHQGDIDVASTKNKGSRFTITLSRTPPAS